MVWTQLISSLVAPIPDWICTSELATIWMSSMAMNWPMTMPPNPRKTWVQFTWLPSAPRIVEWWCAAGGAAAIGSLAASSAIGLAHDAAPGVLGGREAGLGEARSGVLGHVDPHLHGKAGTERAGQGLAAVDGDLHRQALCDLGEVADGVLHRDHRELRARGGREAVDAALDGLLAEGVGLDLHRLADAQTRDLGLLEVRHDVGVSQRHHAHQRPAGPHILADADALGADHAGYGRADLGAGKVNAGLVDGGAGRGSLG